ncbi:MAG TPA: hypothetical protein VHT05_05580 [Candidatus Elarobacter sp.]|jgi:hypothetical protein|nr:hypothetical protein [Candidatus Elarobacter sp.]
MRRTDRARAAAPAVLAAVAGTASVGIAALARAGVCLHRLGWFGLHAPAAPLSGMSMPGMVMPAAGSAAATSGPCPILSVAALAAGALYLAALIVVLALRPRPAELAFAAARLVVGLRLGPLTAALAAIAAVPLGGALLMDGAPGITPYLAAIFLAACAALGAGVLIALSRFVLSFAHRLVVALLAPPARLAPGAGAPWLGRRALVPVPAGVRLARRRPSRAPPIR